MSDYRNSTTAEQPPALLASTVARVIATPALQANLWDTGFPIFPAELLENLAVGEPARRCWMVLWRWAGCKPGHVRCDAASLMHALGARSDRTVRGYRNELAKLGAITIIDDGARWVLYVNEPNDVASDRPKLNSPGRWKYLAFMLEEPADDAGSFCARTPAISPAETPAGAFAQKVPADTDPETLSFQETCARLQAEAREQVARGAPPPVGDLFQARKANLARDSLGRPNVLTPNVPVAHRKDAQDVLGVAKDLRNGDGGRSSQTLNLAERIEFETQELESQLGNPAARSDALTLVVAWLVDGAITEGQLRILTENAAECGVANRWAYAIQSFRQQLALCPTDKLQAAGLWHAKHGPFEYRDDQLRRKLHDAGIRWRREWGHFRKAPRNVTPRTDQV